MTQWLWTLAAVALGLLVVIGAGTAFGYWRRRWQGTTNPARQLFAELCAAHHIDRAGRSLLTRLAAARGIDHAARLFVEPDQFRVEDFGPGWASQRDEVAALGDTIFHQRLTRDGEKL